MTCTPARSRASISATRPKPAGSSIGEVRSSGAESAAIVPVRRIRVPPSVAVTVTAVGFPAATVFTAEVTW